MNKLTFFYPDFYNTCQPIEFVGLTPGDFIVAGGYALHAAIPWLTGKKPKWNPGDIDIFFLSHNAYTSTVAKLHKVATVESDSRVARVTLPAFPYELNLISPQLFLVNNISQEGIIELFDLNVTQVWIYGDGLYVSQAAAQGIFNHRLELVKGNDWWRKTRRRKTLRRTTKYEARGFAKSPKLLKWYVENMPMIDDLDFDTVLYSDDTETREPEKLPFDGNHFNRLPLAYDDPYNDDTYSY